MLSEVITSPKLSSRASKFLEPPLEYVTAQVQALGNQYSTKNEQGAIPLAVAENKLMIDVFLQKINSFSLFSPDALCYTSGSGMPKFRQILAEFLACQVFGFPSFDESKRIVSSENIIVSAGCCALLHQLSLILFEANDSVLIPTPYYPAFDHDFWDLGDVYVGEVNTEDGSVSSVLTQKALDAAYAKANIARRRPKALLLSHPNNPLGTVYSRDELLLAVAWCREKGLHLICDEVYALSVFDGSTTFESIVQVLDNDLGDDIHVLWSLSKDFGGSGLRVGVLYSQNTTFIKAMGSCNDSFTASNLTQELASSILQDTEFTTEYILENSRRLAASHDIVESGLRQIGIPIIPSVAGVFVFANLRSLLREDTFDAEDILNRELISMGIVATPGRACHCPQPGYFRICFAWVPPSSLEEAIRRLGWYASNFVGPRVDDPVNRDNSNCAIC